MRLYRHREDRLPSVWIFSVFAIQLATFFWVDNLWYVFFVMLGLLACSAGPGAISHNHHHTPTFSRPGLNRAYEVVLFLETGILPYGWTLHHNLGHHKHYLDQALDPSRWQHKNGQLMSRVYYDLVNAALIYPQICQVGRQYPKVYSRFKLWAVVSLAVLGLFLFLDPLKALILFVAPMPIMYIGLLDNTYMQHCDLDTSSPMTASRNTTNKLYNLISWNLGYHTAHHMHPDVHWSKLPELYRSIEAEIPDGVKCQSVLLSACSYRHSRDAVPVQAKLAVDAAPACPALAINPALAALPEA